MTTSKRCYRCERDLAPESFYADNSSRDGLQGKCKACSREILAEYRATHKEEAKERARSWEARNRDKYLAGKARYNASHRAQQKRWNRDWYAKHKDGAHLQSAEWALANPDKRKQIQRRSAKKHLPEIAALAAQRRSAERRTTAENMTVVKGFYVYVRNAAKLRCYWCKKQTRKDERHVDHIIPLSKGGQHIPTNLCCSCGTCNHKKSARSAFDFCGQGELELREAS